MKCPYCGQEDLNIDEDNDMVSCGYCLSTWESLESFCEEVAPWQDARKRPIAVQFREVLPITHIRTHMPSRVEVWGEVLNTGHEGAITFAYPDTDFIIKDEAGEYPIKKEIFKKTYDVIEEFCEDSDKEDPQSV